MAPEIKEKTITGKVVEACTSATRLAESDSEVIIQPAPTAWIMPPKLERILAIQIARNVVFCSGASDDVAGKLVILGLAGRSQF